jgi:hypothetical protein
VAALGCDANGDGGAPCSAPRMHGASFCFWHNPETQQEAAEARRLGGLRRRREATVAGAYEFEGLASAAHVRRLLEVAVTDTLSLENSIARSRALAYLAQVAMKTLETGELEGRLASLEAAVTKNRVVRASAVDGAAAGIDFVFEKEPS